MRPRNAPTALATTITIIESRMASSRVGQVTRRNSAMVSPMKRALNTRRLSLTNGLLPDLSVELVGPATGAVLLQLQPVRVVTPVLGRVVGPLAAVGATEIDEDPAVALPGHGLPA